jgi:ferritin
MLVERFSATVKNQAALFADAPICKRLQTEGVCINDYHTVLKRIFHQVQESASTFSLAAANCDNRHFEVKSYLMKHAEEEKLHWEWILNDLRTTGYEGKDPREDFADPTAQAYIAYNYYMAVKRPIGRLAIAAVLENIGATHGKNFATILCQQLHLRPDQAQFFFGHGDTDVGHTQEILDVLSRANLDEKEWQLVCNIGETAGVLYRQLYY